MVMMIHNDYDHNQHKQYPNAFRKHSAISLPFFPFYPAPFVLLQRPAPG